MKKILFLVLILVLTFSFVACTSIDKVEKTILNEGYVVIDMESSEGGTATNKRVADSIRPDYDTIKNIEMKAKAVKYYAYAVIPTSIQGFLNMDYVFVVEFLSKADFIRELEDNETLVAYLTTYIDTPTYSKLQESGLAVDNCLIIIKGGKATDTYNALIAK